MARSRGESLRLTDEQSSNTSGGRTFGTRVRQRHTKTFRKREARHNAAGGTQRCGLQRRQLSMEGCRRHLPSFLFHSRYRDSCQLDHVQNQTLEPRICSRVAMEGASVLARASTTASGISSLTNLLSSSSASTNLIRSLLDNVDVGGSRPGLRRPHGETKVLALHGLHLKAARSESCDHCSKIQFVKDRGLINCIKSDHQAPHVGIASLFTRVPEKDALVASTDVKIILPDMYTLLLQSRQKLEHKGARNRTTSSSS